MIWERVCQEVEFSAIRSRGPGGQNVNKVSSAMQLTWAFEFSSALNADEIAMVRSKLQHRINQEGQIYLRSDEYRDQPRNRDRCLEKLQDLLESAFFKQKPRKKTKPSRAAKARRVDSKRQRSDTKRLRGRVRDD